ncbi:MAG: J domain-containing protein [Alphaproteobacteria bacterium]|nr:J domain-containing protein [Alphaproteobacteria bacterium]
MPRAARSPRFSAPRFSARRVAAETEPRGAARPCDVAGCAEAGEFRAPRSRTSLNEYHWFCLAHVRAYNAAWDYFKGMSPQQIEAEIRQDPTWQRPTWPLGKLQGATLRPGGQRSAERVFHDPLGLFADGREAEAAARRRAEKAAEDAPAAVRPALSVMGLSWPVSMIELKSRYKELVKRHHPDANGGDKDAEERLKSINQAYTTLRGSLAPRPAG